MLTWEQREAQRTAEAEEMRNLVDGGTKSVSWDWNEELEKEEARGCAHPEGVPVSVPNAPPEVAEGKDPLIEHGEFLGARGHGRAPLPFAEAKTSAKKGKDSSEPAGATRTREVAGSGPG